MQIRIYHTNDIHANFDFLKRVRAYLKLHKKPGDLYLDSGDFLDMKSIMVMGDQGKMALELLKDSLLDAMAVGNNELDLGRKSLEVLTSVSVPLLSCNVAGEEGEQIPGLASSLILERGGHRFLLLGISPYFGKDGLPGMYNTFFLMGQLQTTDPYAAIRAELMKHAGTFDHVILLSHSGSVFDREILAAFPEIELCLGGHLHEMISDGPYSQSGMGEALGRVTVELEGFRLRILENCQIFPEAADDPAFDALLAEREKAAERLLSRELPIFRELAFDPYRECPLTNFICDALLKEFGGDLALIHQGIAEGPLKRPVSRKSLIETFPSKLNPTFYTITGKALKEAVRLSWDSEHIRSSGLGPGFRGSRLGTLAFSHNVRICQTPFAIFVNGKEVEDERSYRLVTDDYLQRGSGYPSLAVPDEEAGYHRWFIRDLVEAYMNDESLISGLSDQHRIQYE